MRGVAPGIAAVAPHADALTAPGIDADRDAPTIRRLRLPPARPRQGVAERPRPAIGEQSGAGAMVTGTISSRSTVMAPVLRCDHYVGSDSR